MTRYGTSTVPRDQEGVASGIGAALASAASCCTGVIQYVVSRVPPLLHSFPILIGNTMNSKMLRSEIRCEIFYLPLPSRHGKER
ncbi:hypothetical protein Vadar_003874 [Vaccinium darrowii]|uniref:Uncharacterized protein n=1 Tax=Vaccinium darrowii TaxID=229202 RepID=A0ACB7XPE9_9ERIC|nr:hypothetical protein Vadar_003874 [Vaccinium darrowii]